MAHDSGPSGAPSSVWPESGSRHPVEDPRRDSDQTHPPTGPGSGGGDSQRVHAHPHPLTTARRPGQDRGSQLFGVRNGSRTDDPGDPSPCPTVTRGSRRDSVDPHRYGRTRAHGRRSWDSSRTGPEKWVTDPSLPDPTRPSVPARTTRTGVSRAAVPHPPTHPPTSSGTTGTGKVHRVLWCDSGGPFRTWEWEDTTRDWGRVRRPREPRLLPPLPLYRHPSPVRTVSGRYPGMRPSGVSSRGLGRRHVTLFGGGRVCTGSVGSTRRRSKLRRLMWEAEDTTRGHRHLVPVSGRTPIPRLGRPEWTGTSVVARRDGGPHPSAKGTGDRPDPSFLTLGFPP